MTTPNDSTESRGNWPEAQNEADGVARDHVLDASARLARFGVLSWPTFDPADGTYTGLLAIAPDQLFDLLNDLDLGVHRAPNHWALAVHGYTTATPDEGR